MKLPHRAKAFTLIELIISVAIIVAMTTILLDSYPESLLRTNLFNLSNNIVLLLRESQVKGSSIDSQNDTISGYGLYFKKDTNQIIYFADAGSKSAHGNNLYDGAGEAISTVKISTGYLINKLCSTSPCDNLGELAVSFTRPSVRANISPSNVNPPFGSIACIELSTVKTPPFVRSIQVYSFGRIMSSAQACP